MNNFLSRQRVLFVATAFAMLGSMLGLQPLTHNHQEDAVTTRRIMPSAIQPAARGATSFASEDDLVPLM